MTENKKIYGFLAQFKDPGALVEAAHRVRQAGFQRFDCHSPFPIHGLDEAMGLKQTRLGWFFAAAGFMGAGAAFLMQWWVTSVDYPLVISGKPFFSLPSYIPIIFEISVLVSGFGILFGLLGLSGLPQWHHPLFHSERFSRTTDDGFFMSIEAKDPKFDVMQTGKFLETLGGGVIEVINED